MKDKNNLPRYAERVPYIVIENSSSKLLKDQIMCPEDFFCNKNIRINAKYYIEKQILPVVHRFLEPLDVNVDDWYSKYPRPKRNRFNLYHSSNKSENNINLFHFFKKDNDCKKDIQKFSNNPFLSRSIEDKKLDVI